MAVFALAGGHHRTVKMATHQLHAVTDAEHRHTKLKEFFGDGRSALIVNGFRSTGEDDPLGSEGLDLVQGHVIGVQFTVDVSFAHSTCDKLSVLGTEIEDKNFFAMDILGHALSVWQRV